MSRRYVPDTGDLVWLTFDPQPTEPDPDFVLHDEDFHIRLAEASGNRSLAEILTRDVYPRLEDLGLTIHPNDPDTIWVCPGTSSYKHWVPDGQMAVHRTRDQGTTNGHNGQG